jgi:hypothetical protein
VIETGQPVAHVAAETGIGEQVPTRCLMPMNAQSWSVCAGKTPNYVWTVDF